MKIFLKHILSKLSFLFLVATTIVSIEQNANYSIAELLSLGEISFVESEQMEEEVEVETELNTKNLVELFAINFYANFTKFNINRRSITVMGFFFPNVISPPPDSCLA